MFNIAVIGYCNSPAYIQQMINCLLWCQRPFTHTYVNDIMIFLKTLIEHLCHLNDVFQVLTSMWICLLLRKLFLGYPSVQLLGQCVNALGLSTAEDKLKAILSLAFLQTLQQLETYLGMTGYLCQYILLYTAIIKPLQLHKTCLNCGINSTRGAHKCTAGTTWVSLPTPKELNMFHHLQSLFARPSMLAHFDPTRQL